MTLTQIDPRALTIQPHELFEFKSLLLTSGDYSKNKFNAMTIGWGSMGTMWNLPYVVVVVRPTRFTYKFMEEFEDFTVTAFPDAYQPALKLLGTRSGRDGDKIILTDLTPCPAQKVHSPSFAEAELSIECKKIYWQDLDPTHFWDVNIHNSYPRKDYHRIYYGEIVNILGSADYLK